MTKNRISKRDLPRASKCPCTECVYNEVGACDDVRINKDNSDSLCYALSNKRLLSILNGEVA